MIKYGLKIWSINKENIFPKAVALVEKKEVDFIEFYLVPGTDFKKLDILKKASLTIHCPHTSHGFDIFNFDEKTIKIFKNEVQKAADFFKSEYIIVHPGLGTDNSIFKENIAKIYDKRILIENLPKYTGTSEGFGHSSEQLKFIHSLGFDICLDFIHAVKSSISQNIDYKKFIEELIEALNTFYFHLTSANLQTDQDEHLDLFEGEFDVKWVKNKLVSLAENKDIYLVFECPKVGDNFENDMKNINYFRGLN